MYIAYIRQRLIYTLNKLKTPSFQNTCIWRDPLWSLWEPCVGGRPDVWKLKCASLIPRIPRQGTSVCIQWGTVGTELTKGTVHTSSQFILKKGGVQWDYKQNCQRCLTGSLFPLRVGEWSVQCNTIIIVLYCCFQYHTSKFDFWVWFMLSCLFTLGLSWLGLYYFIVFLEWVVWFICAVSKNFFKYCFCPCLFPTDDCFLLSASFLRVHWVSSDNLIFSRQEIEMVNKHMKKMLSITNPQGNANKTTQKKWS